MTNVDAKAKSHMLLDWRENFQAEVTRPSWDDQFLTDAFKAARRSLDAQTKCCCILVRDKLPLSSGYNSFVRDIDDSVLPNLRPAKYDWMLHAEQNAWPRSLVDFEP